MPYQNDKDFEAVWDVIKTWEIGRREIYAGATGTDAINILDALAHEEAKRLTPRVVYWAMARVNLEISKKPPTEITLADIMQAWYLMRVEPNIPEKP